MFMSFSPSKAIRENNWKHGVLKAEEQVQIEQQTPSDKEGYIRAQKKGTVAITRYIKKSGTWGNHWKNE